MSGMFILASYFDVAMGGWVLSVREKQILALVAAGLTNRGIGNVLGTKGSTVRNQLYEIYRRLGLHNRAAVTAWWVQSGGEVGMVANGGGQIRAEAKENDNKR